MRVSKLLMPAVTLAGALALAGCGGGSSTTASGPGGGGSTPPEVVEPTAVQRAIDAAETAVAGLDEDSTRAEVVAAGERITEARAEILDLAAADRADPRVTVNGIAATLDLTARLDVIDKVATAVTLSTAETVDINATDAAIKAAQTAIAGLADATLGTAYAAQLSDPMSALATARNDETSKQLLADQNTERDEIAAAVKEAGEKVAAVDSATDNAAATEADAAIQKIRDVIAGLEAVPETDASVIAANAALEQLVARLGPAKTRLAARIKEATDLAEKETREAANKAAAAVENAIKRHNATSVSAVIANSAITEVKLSRKNGDTVISLRDGDGRKRAGDNATSPGVGWNGDSFSFTDQDGVMQKGAVFSNIKSAKGQAYDDFFRRPATSGSVNRNTAYNSSTGQLRFDSTSDTGLEATFFTGDVIPARNGDDTNYDAPGGDNPLNTSGTYRGIPGTFTCAAACAISRGDDGTIDITSGELAFKPTLSSGQTLADLFVENVIPDAAHLHFGYWMASSKQRDGTYRHVIDTFAGPGGSYAGIGDAPPQGVGGRTTGSATYEGAAGGYYTHEDSRDGPLERTHGEFSAEASLKVNFTGNTIPAAEHNRVSGTISNFIGDGPADLSDWTLMLKTDTGDGDGYARSGKTSDSQNPGAEDGDWSAWLLSSDGNNAPQVVDAIMGEFNGNFENGHVAGAFGAEHTE